MHCRLEAHSISPIDDHSIISDDQSVRLSSNYKWMTSLNWWFHTEWQGNLHWALWYDFWVVLPSYLIDYTSINMRYDNCKKIMCAQETPIDFYWLFSKISEKSYELLLVSSIRTESQVLWDQSDSVRGQYHFRHPKSIGNLKKLWECNIKNR